MRSSRVRTIVSLTLLQASIFSQGRGQSPRVTTITIGPAVLRKSVKPMGINLGQSNFYDSGQILKNLINRNPGFEGEIYQSIVKCAAGTKTTCVDDERYSAWKTGFWKDATFEVIYGAAAGRAGKVADSTPSDTKTGGTITFDRPGTAIAPGDYLILRRIRNDRPDAGWWVKGDGSVSPEWNDLPPGTEGRQAIRLNNTGPAQSLTLNAYFDRGDISFVQLHGSYRLTFSAKRADGPGKIDVRFLRAGSAPFIQKTVDLSNEWRQYQIEFVAQESGSAKGACELNFYPARGTTLLDDVGLVPLDGDPANRTIFRDPVVRALRELKPGILRYWAYQLGDSLENQLAPEHARLRSGYSTYQTTEDDIQYGLKAFLDLCETIQAEPWYVVPTAFSPTEMANLIEYLGGDVQTPYGARRAAQGHPVPWTDAFPKIHLEFGNEAWNAGFRGGTIEDAKAYAHRANEMFRAAKSARGYRADRFDLILGGQEVYIERNREILANAGEENTFTVAGYLSSKVDDFSSPEDLFGSLFAEVQASDLTGFIRKNADLLRHPSRTKSLAIYELNLGTTEGAISQEALNGYTPSLGAGLAIASHELTMLRDSGARDQVLWQLPQYDYVRSDHKRVRLYGAVVDMGVTDRRRPQYLAMQAMNEVLSGDLIETRHSGADPTWDQASRNGVAMKGAHYLQSFAFARGENRALIILNLHRSSALTVNFAGADRPKGNVGVNLLTAESITDTNEESNRVVPRRSQIRIDPAEPYSVPPFSLTVLTWNTAAEDAQLRQAAVAPRIRPAAAEAFTVLSPQWR